ncbi:hypothetical protein ILYODFUR_033809 [Ilyodon furcidens]|uniref:Uncharacterized protein n=1 Tax=Ilyodon furcidens TaxID=33524 RepID=A0ABV0TPB9_9TELE
MLVLPASSCPPSCLCVSDSLVVDCGERGLSSLPPMHLLPPGSRSLLLANNKLTSLGASSFANLSSMEVCSLSIVFRKFAFENFISYAVVYHGQTVYSELYTKNAPRIKKLNFLQSQY